MRQKYYIINNVLNTVRILIFQKLVILLHDIRKLLFKNNKIE